MSHLLFPQTITLRRVTGSPTVNSDGEHVPAATSDTSLVASVQPLIEDRETIEPSGKRRSRRIKVYCESMLRSVDQVGSTEADLLIYDGTTFVVQIVKEWPALLDHYYAEAQEVQEDLGA